MFIKSLIGSNQEQAQRKAIAQQKALINQKLI